MYNTLKYCMKTNAQLVKLILKNSYNKTVLLKVVGTLQYDNITIVIINYFLHICIIQCNATVKLFSKFNCSQ